MLLSSMHIRWALHAAQLHAMRGLRWDVVHAVDHHTEFGCGAVPSMHAVDQHAPNGWHRCPYRKRRGGVPVEGGGVEGGGERDPPHIHHLRFTGCRALSVGCTRAEPCETVRRGGWHRTRHRFRLHFQAILSTDLHGDQQHAQPYPALDARPPPHPSLESACRSTACTTPPPHPSHESACRSTLCTTPPPTRASVCM